jgi:hypothetical protein
MELWRELEVDKTGWSCKLGIKFWVGSLSKLTSDHENALKGFYALSYWTRTWISQEIGPSDTHIL